MENFRSLCQRRRSIRKYQNREVEPEKIEYMLQCALMAPSSKRTNPWEFVVVRRVETLRKMQACRTYGSGMFETAMAAIVVAVDSSLTDTWQADGAIAAEHLLLAAEEQGLGACWCQIYGRAVNDPDGNPCGSSEELIRELCGIPETLNVLCVVSLGYKDEERREYDFEKLKYEKIHHEVF
ncbi:MAG: nitroreductase family protein [Paludibacteraceae bacterium]|nr:nitroreductase family protein [Paludibacteraceae bacterium]